MTREPLKAITTGRRRQSAAQVVVRAVVRGLHEGRFAPGQRLAEPELMLQFKVGRSTAREAIRKLEAQGIVDVLPHRGAHIRQLTPKAARDALALLELCLGLAARQAAARIGKGRNRQAMRGALDAVLKAGASDDQHGIYDLIRQRDRFYAAIVGVADNQELKRVMPTIHVHILRRSYSLPLEVRLANYRAIGEAILAGDAVAAEAAARHHIRDTAALVNPA